MDPADLADVAALVCLVALEQVPAGVAVFSTTSSCLTLPMFVTTNVTLPGLHACPGTTLNSFSLTATRASRSRRPRSRPSRQAATTVTASSRECEPSHTTIPPLVGRGSSRRTVDGRACRRGCRRLRGSRRRQRKRSRSRGITSSAALPSPRHVDAADDRGRARRALLPITSSAAPAISSATAIMRRVQLVARAHRVEPRRSRSGASPATPSATSVVPWRQARPNESLTMTPASTPVSSASRSRSARGRGVRVEREQDHGARPLGVRRVDAGGGADEAVARLARSRAAAASARPRLTRAGSPRPGAGRPRRRPARPRAATARRRRGRRSRPSTFETAFWATTTTSPASSPPTRAAASREQPAEVVALLELRQPRADHATPADAARAAVTAGSSLSGRR